MKHRIVINMHMVKCVLEATLESGWNVLGSVVGTKQTRTNTLARKARSLFTEQSEVIVITYICVGIYMQ